MAITASSITSSATLEEFRIQYNNLVTDVSGIQDKNVFSTKLVLRVRQLMLMKQFLLLLIRQQIVPSRSRMKLVQF